MRCKECKSEMVEWQRARQGDDLIIRLRCEVCGWETAEVIEREKPKPKDKE